MLCEIQFEMNDDIFATDPGPALADILVDLAVKVKTMVTSDTVVCRAKIVSKDGNVIGGLEITQD